VLLFVEPHGAGKQWRWLLTSRLLNSAVSRGKFNDIIAQVRFSSEYLWSQAWYGDALSKVHEFLISIFGEFIRLQLSEAHL
jgi:REP element-mobilizing transposase RayT